MPFMSYNISVEEAVRNAGRLVKEGGCEVVKLEGGVDFAPTIHAIVKAGIPVMGHIGLTPQTASAMGGFKIQGKDATAAKQIIDDAKAIEDAGCFSIILEAVPAPLGKLISETVTVPVIGIGAGPDVDGQVLVIHDVVGLYDRFVPKFVKQYANVKNVMLDALADYKQEVADAKFPGPEHSFKMPDEALEQLKQMISG
jgi:3-methyl-2-oxobutanoate hydroxymethyltransferase